MYSQQLICPSKKCSDLCLLVDSLSSKRKNVSVTCLCNLFQPVEMSRSSILLSWGLTICLLSFQLLKLKWENSSKNTAADVKNNKSNKSASNIRKTIIKNKTIYKETGNVT